MTAASDLDGGLAPIVKGGVAPPNGKMYWREVNPHMFLLWARGGGLWTNTMHGAVERRPVVGPNTYHARYIPGPMVADQSAWFPDLSQAMTWVQALHRLEGP